MGMLVDGVWQERGYRRKKTGGAFVRQEAQFRDWVTNDGSSRFAAAPDRYHLYASYACPWAHRTLIFRRLKRLESVISLSIVDPYMTEKGWELSDRNGATPDTINGFSYLHEVYTAARPDVTTRATVPVLWDKELGTIVNNESSDIIRMFNSMFKNAFKSALEESSDTSLDFCPQELRAEIDSVNELVYTNVNNGVYKCGFARRQEPYEQAFDALFATLDELEERLNLQRYLVGSRLTDADWRLFTTLVRFDPVYYSHFKCNLRRVADYPNLSNYLRDLYQYPGVKETVRFDHIKEHYYRSHTSINPRQIVPKGPMSDLDAPHDRHRFASQEIEV